MKRLALFFCFLFVSSQVFADPVIDEDNRKKPKKYFVMNLERTNSPKKFDEMFSLCGGTIVKQLNENSIIAQLSIEQGICVAENTQKIVIQITN